MGHVESCLASYMYDLMSALYSCCSWPWDPLQNCKCLYFLEVPLAMPAQQSLMVSVLGPTFPSDAHAG